MTDLNNPTAGAVTRNRFLFPDFLSTLPDIGDILSFFHSFQCRFACIAFISTQMLLDIFRTIHNDFIKHQFKLADIMLVGPGHDDREWDTTAVG